MNKLHQSSSSSIVGVVLITTVQPVMYAQRPSFYREKYINIYDIKLYTLANTLVELPYLATSSLFFLVPYFFLNKFDEVGVVAEQFFLYFAYVALYTGVIVFMGHFSSTLFPSEPVSTIYTGQQQRELCINICLSIYHHAPHIILLLTLQQYSSHSMLLPLYLIYLSVCLRVSTARPPHRLDEQHAVPLLRFHDSVRQVPHLLELCLLAEPLPLHTRR